jgi:A/G-specific adenine glycosylase
MSRPFTEVLDLPPKELRALVAAMPRLHTWYGSAARDLPWRRTSDPYAVWISEVMLQQTRVATVIPYFDRWMAALPTVRALAGADESLVFKLWEGLGYYSRVRNLHLAAKEIAIKFEGRIPSTTAEFQSLPGVGSYTAGAVLSIAFGVDVPVLDGNVLRVFSRLTALEANPRRPPAAAALSTLAEQLLPAGTARVHNQALMELGALICTPRSPLCRDCPLPAVCRARATGRTEDFPAKAPSRPVPHQGVSIGIVLHGGQVFIDQRPSVAYSEGCGSFQEAR